MVLFLFLLFFCIIAMDRKNTTIDCNIYLFICYSYIVERLELVRKEKKGQETEIVEISSKILLLNLEILYFFADRNPYTIHKYSFSRRQKWINKMRLCFVVRQGFFIEIPYIPTIWVIYGNLLRNCKMNDKRNWGCLLYWYKRYAKINKQKKNHLFFTILE